jgi:antitoxin component YwqK of YwqJK toxin-antitoxin module
MAVAGGLATAGLGAFFSNRRPHDRPAAPPPAERTRDRLELRDGRLVDRETGQPFSGLLVEHHPNGARKVAIEIADGRPHGLSRGWYPDGRPEVVEHFVAGVAHGPRTRWHPNGAKRSEARIVNGRLSGPFVQWHDNGAKAAELTMIDGRPAGVCLGWHRSGAPKSRVVMRAGEVVSRQYWNDLP